MKIIRIDGNLWELTILQASPYNKIVGQRVFLRDIEKNDDE